MANVVFSSLMSFIVAYLVGGNLFAERVSFVDGLLIVLLCIIVFWIVHLLCNAIFGEIQKYNKLCEFRKQEDQPTNIIPTPDKTKIDVDNFDHIACDNILIALEFINHYDSLPKFADSDMDRKTEKDLQTFSFYETQYYLDQSVKITKKLVDRCSSHKDYIKTTDNNNGVDVFRIQNISLLMREIHCFIKTNCDNISICDDMKPELIRQIDKLEEGINEIEVGCLAYIEEHWLPTSKPPDACDP